MRNSITAVCLVSLFAAAAAAQNPAPTTIPNGLPEWAYNIPDKVQPPEPRVPATVRAAGSSKEYEAAAIAGNAVPPDWFPDEHPPAPRSVKGPMPNACGSCHLMSGQGHPESADLAGMQRPLGLPHRDRVATGVRPEAHRPSQPEQPSRLVRHQVGAPQLDQAGQIPTIASRCAGYAARLLWRTQAIRGQSGVRRRGPEIVAERV